MLIPKFIKTIASRISANGNLRPALAGVRITPDYLEATNSYVAVSIQNPFKEVDAKHYPGSLKRTLSDGDITVSKEEIKLIPFKTSKKWAHLSDRAALVTNGEATSASIECYYPDNTKVKVTAQAIQGKFPDIRSFCTPYEKRKGYERSWVSTQYMIDVLTTMRDAGYENVILSICNNKPLFVEPYGRDPKDNSIGLVMPLKL
jgi:hypothetical protein